MRFHLALLLGILCAIPARSIDHACFLAFGNLIAGPQADEAMRATYRDLWQVVGLKHAKPELLKRLGEGDDPYLEKAELPRDLEAMRHFLGEFREMLASKGWDNETTRTLLLKELRSLDSGTAEAAAKQHEALEQVKVTSFNAGWAMPAFSPDGKWLVSHGDATNELWLTNLETRQVNKMTAPFEFTRHENPGMTKDGKYVVATRLSPFQDELRFFPVENGKVEMQTSFTIPFPKVTTFAKKFRGVKEDVTVNTPFPTADPNLVVASLSLSPVPYVFNIEKRTATPLRMNSLTGFTGSLFKGKRVELGSVGGTGELFWMNATKQGIVTLYRGTVDKNGLSKVTVAGSWPGFTHEHSRSAKTNWSQDGKVAVSTLNGLLYYVDGSGVREIFAAHSGLKSGGEYTVFATPTPDGKKIAVILNNNESLFGKLLWYDVATKKWTHDVRRFPMYARQQIKTSPDGTKLFFRGDNYEQTKSMALELE